MKIPIFSYINCFENEGKRIKIRGGFTLPNGQLMVLTTKNSNSTVPVKKTGKYFVRPSFAAFPTGTPVMVGDNISGYIIVDQNLINFSNFSFMQKIHLAALAMFMFDPNTIKTIYPGVALPRIGAEDLPEDEKAQNFLTLGRTAKDEKQIKALQKRAEKFNEDVIAALQAEVVQVATTLGLAVEYTPSLEEALEMLEIKSQGQEQFENKIVEMIDVTSTTKETSANEEKEEVSEETKEEVAPANEETKEEAETSEAPADEETKKEESEETKEEVQAKEEVSQETGIVAARPEQPVITAIQPVITAIEAIATAVAETAKTNADTAKLLAETARTNKEILNKLFPETTQEGSPATEGAEVTDAIIVN